MNKLFSKFLCIAFSNGPVRGNCFLYKVCCIISSKLKSDPPRVVRSQKNMILNRRPTFFWVLTQTEYIHVIFPLPNQSFLRHVNNFLRSPNLPGLVRPQLDDFISIIKKVFCLAWFHTNTAGKDFCCGRQLVGNLSCNGFKHNFIWVVIPYAQHKIWLLPLTYHGWDNVFHSCPFANALKFIKKAIHYKPNNQNGMINEIMTDWIVFCICFSYFKPLYKLYNYA